MADKQEYRGWTIWARQNSAGNATAPLAWFWYAVNPLKTVYSGDAVDEADALLLATAFVNEMKYRAVLDPERQAAFDRLDQSKFEDLSPVQLDEVRDRFHHISDSHGLVLERWLPEFFHTVEMIRKHGSYGEYTRSLDSAWRTGIKKFITQENAKPEPVGYRDIDTLKRKLRVIADHPFGIVASLGHSMNGIAIIRALRDTKTVNYDILKRIEAQLANSVLLSIRWQLDLRADNLSLARAFYEVERLWPLTTRHDFVTHDGVPYHPDRQDYAPTWQGARTIEESPGSGTSVYRHELFDRIVGNERGRDYRRISIEDLNNLRDEQIGDRMDAYLKTMPLDMRTDERLVQWKTFIDQHIAHRTETDDGWNLPLRRIYYIVRKLGRTYNDLFGNILSETTQLMGPIQVKRDNSDFDREFSKSFEIFSDRVNRRW